MGKAQANKSMLSEIYILLPVPYLTKYFNSLSGGMGLFQTASLAQVTVFPKLEKDTSLCTYFRPISLTNLDVNFLAKIMTERLKPHIEDLIYQDQVGLIHGREIIWYRPCLVLSSYAEKAFDRTDWRFKIEILKTLLS